MLGTRHQPEAKDWLQQNEHNVFSSVKVRAGPQIYSPDFAAIKYQPIGQCKVWVSCIGSVQHVEDSRQIDGLGMGMCC